MLTFQKKKDLCRAYIKLKTFGDDSLNPVLHVRAFNIIVMFIRDIPIHEHHICINSIWPYMTSPYP